MRNTAFEYGGYHFVPVGTYDHSDNGFQQTAFRLRTDHTLGHHALNYHGTQRFQYDYEGFYQAAGSIKD